MRCPKCFGTMYQAEFLRCIQSGWEDYSSDKKDMVIPRRKEFRGDVTVVRYKGTADIHKGVMLAVQCTRSKNQRLAIYVPECPYCSRDMEPKNMSNKSTKSKYKTGRIYHYHCTEGHVIYLETNATGLTGWMVAGDTIDKRTKKKAQLLYNI